MPFVAVAALLIAIFKLLPTSADYQRTAVQQDKPAVTKPVMPTPAR